MKEAEKALTKIAKELRVKDSRITQLRDVVNTQSETYELNIETIKKQKKRIEYLSNENVMLNKLSKERLSLINKLYKEITDYKICMLDYDKLKKDSKKWEVLAKQKAKRIMILNSEFDKELKAKDKELKEQNDKMLQNLHTSNINYETLREENEELRKEIDRLNSKNMKGTENTNSEPKRIRKKDVKKLCKELDLTFVEGIPKDSLDISYVFNYYHCYEGKNIITRYGLDFKDNGRYVTKEFKTKQERNDYAFEYLNNIKQVNPIISK